MSFLQRLNLSIDKNNSLVCVGLDTDIDKVPKFLLKKSEPIFEFNKAIIDSTKDLVCCYKANLAFYAASGVQGLEALKKTIDYIHSLNLTVIVDAKLGDIGNTSKHYAKEIFDYFGADAVTLNPYQGKDSLEPFLERKDKGIIILCKTSNPGSLDFQDLLVDNQPLYIHVAKKIMAWNKEYGNCLLVVGATSPSEMRKIREVAPDLFFLVPGVGLQGGDLKSTLENGLTKEKSGLLIHSSRAIIYASNGSDFAQKAREKAVEFKNQLNQYRK